MSYKLSTFTFIDDIFIQEIEWLECCDQELSQFSRPGSTPGYIDYSFSALSKIILTKSSGSLTSLLLLLLLLPPLLLLLVADRLLVSPSFLVFVAATLELDVRVMVGVLVLVKAHCSLSDFALKTTGTWGNHSHTEQGLRRTRKLRQCTNWKVNLQICELAKASKIENWSV